MWILLNGKNQEWQKGIFFFSSKLLQNAKPLKCVNVGLLFWTKIFHWILNKCHAKRHTKKLFSIDSWFRVLIRNFDSKGGKNAQNGQKMWIDSDVHIEINTPIHMPQSPLAYNSISCLWVFWTKFIRYAYTIYVQIYDLHSNRMHTARHRESVSNLKFPTLLLQCREKFQSICIAPHTNGTHFFFCDCNHSQFQFEFNQKHTSTRTNHNIYLDRGTPIQIFPYFQDS